MAPPSAIDTPSHESTRPPAEAPLEAEMPEVDAKVKMPSLPKPPKFDDPYKERAYLKGRLAAAFRIFGKYGFDEGVAGHITLRVRRRKKFERDVADARAGSSGPVNLLGEPVRRGILPHQSFGPHPRQRRGRGYRRGPMPIA